MSKLTLLLVALGLANPASVAADSALTIVPPKAGTAVPKDGKVPAVTWTVEWLLRDDKKAVLGDLSTHRTFASAQAVATKKLSDRGDPRSWTYIKSVVIKAEAELVSPDELPASQKWLWKAILAGVEKKREPAGCNYLVRDVAAEAKAPGLADKTADQMWGYFNTAAAKDGWVEVKGEKAKGATSAVSAIEAANRAAEEGFLVVGVISKESLNEWKTPSHVAHGQGHVFVVTPAGGTDWSNSLTANEVLNGGAGTYTLAKKLFETDKQRDAVQFYAIPLSKK